MSNNDVELDLTPQTVLSGGSLKNLSEAFSIPLIFSFGRIDIILSR